MTDLRERLDERLAYLGSDRQQVVDDVMSEIEGVSE